MEALACNSDSQLQLVGPAAYILTKRRHYVQVRTVRLPAPARS
jgi:hypothetical protein